MRFLWSTPVIDYAEKVHREFRALKKLASGARLRATRNKYVVRKATALARSEAFELAAARLLRIL